MACAMFSSVGFVLGHRSLGSKIPSPSLSTSFCAVEQPSLSTAVLIGVSGHLSSAFDTPSRSSSI